MIFLIFHYRKKPNKNRMPPKEEEPAARLAASRTVTPVCCAYDELLRQETHVLAAVERVRAND